MSSRDDSVFANIRALIADRNGASHALFETILRTHGSLLGASARQLIDHGSVVIERPEGVVEARVATADDSEVIMEWRTLSGLACGNSVIKVDLENPDASSARIVRCLAVGLLNIAEAAHRVDAPSGSKQRVLLLRQLLRILVGRSRRSRLSGFSDSIEIGRGC